jgi:CRP-like cAMP-binding protein
MIENNLDINLFKTQMRDSLLKETKNSQSVKFAKHNNVYLMGDEIEMVYFIESGEVKLVTESTDGKDCLLAIHSAGDIFGELCMAGFRGSAGNRNRNESYGFETDSCETIP